MRSSRQSQRLGTVTVVGALLVLGGSGPAWAAGADAKDCPKGVDPQSTIDNIICQTKENVEDIKEKIDEIIKPKPKPKPTAPKPKPKPVKDEPAAEPKPKAKPKPPAAPAVQPQAAVRNPVGARPLSIPEEFQRLPAAQPGVLPAIPQVAPQAPAAHVETHLMAPVAAVSPLDADGQRQRALWTAAASAAVTGVVMLQFSVVGAGLRRRARLED